MGRRDCLRGTYVRYVTTRSRAKQKIRHCRPRATGPCAAVPCGVGVRPDMCCGKNALTTTGGSEEGEALDAPPRDVVDTGFDVSSTAVYRQCSGSTTSNLFPQIAKDVFVAAVKERRQKAEPCANNGVVFFVNNVSSHSPVADKLLEKEHIKFLTFPPNTTLPDYQMLVRLCFPSLLRLSLFVAAYSVAMLRMLRWLEPSHPRPRRAFATLFSLAAPLPPNTQLMSLMRRPCPSMAVQ